MRRSVWLGLVATSFSILPACGGGDSKDAEPDAMPDGPPPPCEFRYADVCVNLEGTTDRIFAVSAEIDTDTSTECARPPAVLATTPYCIISGTSISISAGVTLRATGSRPLVFAASGALTVDGTIDVSSRRATRAPDPVAAETVGAAGNYAMCTAFRRQVDRNVNGGGGGAGGTFGGVGGNGGDGNYDIINDRAQGGLAPLEPDLFPTSLLRGGCRGQDGGGNGPAATNGGRGGAGGGVVFLASKMGIVINGVVAANGAGGTGGGAQAGGAGGGTGGLIVLQAATIRRNGKLTANGGGGGEGGAIDLGEVIGADGTDGGVNASPAPGGDSALPESSGGRGGARNGPGGDSGTPSDDAGGGGGGGVGFIHIYGTTSKNATAQESPDPVVAN
jgi:hypothetical protein